MKRVAFYALTLLSLLGLGSCADDTEVGSGLLGADDIEVISLDDFDLVITQLGPQAIAQIGDDVPLFQRHSLGGITNAEFGSISSSFYIRPQLPAGTLVPNFANATLDSVAIILKVDSARFYGNPRGLHDISVYALEEPYEVTDTVRTDQELLRSEEPVGTVERVVLSELDSIFLLDGFGLMTSFEDALRITLRRRFGSDIFQDTARNNTEEGIAELINGFYVESTSGNSIAQFDLNDEVSSMVFFYKDSLSINQNFPYRFGTYNPTNFIHDISGSNLEQAIADNGADDRLFLQGHSGPTIEIDIADVLSVEEPFINLATLEFFVDQSSLIDTVLFGYPLAVDLFTLDSSGVLVPVVDLNIGREVGQTLGIFNGSIENDDFNELVRYEMNITNHVKGIFDGTQSSKLFLTVRDRIQNPNSVVIFGPNHPTFPAKLKLTYTKS